ncbi:MAG: CBS domain-containing protein [Bacillota bacterium]
MQISNLMTDQVTTVDSDSSVTDAARVMRDLNVGVVPVCQGEKPVGMITDRDITIRNVAENKDLNTPVKQIMSEELVMGSPDMNAEQAAQLMGEKQIRRLPIVEDNNLIGIVSLGDLAVANQTNMEAGDALSTISTPSKPNK